jgi:hypothetical protein
MASIANPNVKIIEGKGVEMILVSNTSRVKGLIKALG